ncbi:hypothetical protein HYU16_03715 [Candidatus Woesearchaeota archaeon]|nr:hypothetical protein [Candidatus Woesearchaeota archaeon]
MFFGYDSTAFASGWAVFALAFSLWELTWKGFGLWRAARNSHRWWFVSILVFNTLGILPILYYFFFSGRQQQAAAAAQTRQTARKARKKRWVS